MHHGCRHHHHCPRLEEDHQREVVEEVEVHRQGEEEVAAVEQQHQRVVVEVVQRVLILPPASRSQVRREPLQLGVLAEEEAARWDCFLVQELRISTRPLRSKV
jgi:hypothetical protein